MTKLATMLLAGSLLAAASQSFTGIITCTMCKKDHTHMGVTPDEKCVRECIQHGSKYALFDGTNLYKLSDQQTPGKYAAQKVKVTGVLYQKTGIIKVEKIEPLR